MPENELKVAEDQKLLDSFQKRNYKEKRREKHNWDVYDATDYRSWNPQAVRQAVQEGRSLDSWNFTKKHVDITVGSIIADPFEVRFDTELGDENSNAIMLNELFLEDKDIGNWNLEYWHFVRAGFVYKGFLYMFEDKSNDARGRVGLKYFSPDRIVMDPDRRGHHINDNKNIFVHTWMSAQQIKDKYGASGEEIEEAIDIHKRVLNGGEIREESDIGKLFDTSPEYFDKINDLFLVVDRFFLVQKRTFQVFSIDTGEVVSEQPREEDAMRIAKAQRLNGVSTRIIPKKFMETRIRTTCPGLSKKLVIQDGKTRLQLGRYPLFEFSSDSINGRPNTYVDQLKDPQISFNKRESTITHILMTQANNALLIETDAVEDEDDIDTIGKGRGRPGAYFKVAPGTIAQKKIHHLEKGTPPNDFLNAAKHHLEIIRELTPAVPATQAVGATNESGVLFQSKVAQAQIAMQLPTKYLGVFWHEFGDAYIKAAKQIYTYPMAFKSSRSGENFFLNVPGGVDIAGISRLKVTVSQSPSSETYRRQLLQSYLAIVQYLHDPYTRSELSRIVVKLLPGVPEEEKEQLGEAAKLSSEAQRLALMAQIQQMGGALQQGQAAEAPQQTPTPQNREDPQALLNQLSGGAGQQGGPPANAV